MSERSEVTKWFFLFLGAIVAISVLGFTLNSLGLLGSTFVERKVFEQSYQRSEGLVQQIATMEASLAEIEAQLQNPTLDEGTKAQLRAQRAAIRVQLNAAQRRAE